MRSLSGFGLTAEDIIVKEYSVTWVVNRGEKLKNGREVEGWKNKTQVTVGKKGRWATRVCEHNEAFAYIYAHRAMLNFSSQEAPEPSFRGVDKQDVPNPNGNA
jgi:hypothetical protein